MALWPCGARHKCGGACLVLQRCVTTFLYSNADWRVARQQQSAGADGRVSSGMLTRLTSLTTTEHHLVTRQCLLCRQHRALSTRRRAHVGRQGDARPAAGVAQPAGRAVRSARCRRRQWHLCRRRCHGGCCAAAGAQARDGGAIGGGGGRGSAGRRGAARPPAGARGRVLPCMLLLPAQQGQQSCSVVT